MIRDNCTLCDKASDSEFCKSCDKKLIHLAPTIERVSRSREETSTISSCKNNFKKSYQSLLDDHDKKLQKIIDKQDELLNELRFLEPGSAKYKTIQTKISDLEKRRKKERNKITIINYKKNNDIFMSKYILYKTDEQFDDIKRGVIDDWIGYIKIDSLLLYGDENFLVQQLKEYNKDLVKGFKILSEKQRKFQNVLIDTYRNTPAPHERCFDLLEEVIYATRYNYLDEINLNVMNFLKNYYHTIESGGEPLFKLEDITEGGNICQSDCEKEIINYYCKVNKLEDNKLVNKKEKCNIYPKRK